MFSKPKSSGSENEIVISGMSGRFPNSSNMADFAYNLYNKIDMIDDKETRWTHTDPEIPRRSGKTVNLEKFDASFFSVHNRQANAMDPQCRMLLEHSYEAVLDAGINPKSLRGSRTGVFVGCSSVESEDSLMYNKIPKDGLGLTGCSRALIANRVSFSLGLIGPSFILDSACSSGMYALDSAYNAIRFGICDAALVGGCNLLIHPNTTKQFARLGVLSKDGFCRPFDKDANGYTRAEAVSVIFLQKSVDANRIYASVVHSKTSNDGYKKEGLTYPSGQMQTKLLKEFYEDLKMDPSKVDFIEAHSTATFVGDPEECDTLDTIFCQGRAGKSVAVGSVKSNMGHSEASAGLCSISKIMLIFETGLIAPNINFKEGRPGIPALIEGRMRVVHEVEPFLGSLASVNSFGFGGANAHALFKRHDKVKKNFGIPDDDLPRIVLWSGRTEDAVKNIINDVSQRQLDGEFVALLNNLQSETNSSNTYRGYGIFTQTGNEENANCVSQSVQHFDGVKRQIVWAYSGMGSQWCQMGADLMKIPIFANAVEKCHKILVTRGVNLKEILTSPDPKMFDNILHSFVGIAAIQIGLTDVLKALGLEPDYIIGHSVGELGCAYADGCFTAEEMILSSYSRGMASLETEVVFGSMAAVGLGYQKLKEITPDGIVIACHNSADSSTISGPADLIASFVDQLKKQNIFAKEVQCSNIPYHSKYIANMGPRLLERLTEVIKTPKTRSSRWISSSIPKDKWNNSESQLSSAQYHTNNLLSSVLFEEATENLPKDALVIEIAPHGLLQSILKGSLPNAINISLTKREEPNTVFLLNAIGKLFELGVDMEVANLYPKVEFPVSRGTPQISHLIKWDHSEDYFVAKYESSTAKSEKIFRVDISDQDYEFMVGHTIDGRVLLPATGYLFFVWQAFADMNRKSMDTFDIEFEDIKFLRATTLTPNTEIELIVVIHAGSGKFEINEGHNSIVTGVVRSATNDLTSFDGNKNTESPSLHNKDFYKELRLRGYNYSGLFRSVVDAGFDGLGGRVKWASNWIAFLDCLLQIQILSKKTRLLMLPTGLRKVIIKPAEHMKYLDSITSADKICDVRASNKMNILRCGGIEIRGLNATLVARKNPPGIPVLETYGFLPHISSATLSPTNFARFSVQLALENQPITRLMVVEIDSDDESEPLVGYFGQALDDLPLITGELNYLTTRSVEIGSAKIQDSSVTSFSNVNFIIRSNVLVSNSQLTAFSSQLCDGGFVISREKKEFTKDSIQTIPSCYRITAIIPTEQEILVVLRYFATEPRMTYKSVKITSKNFDWLNILQEAIKQGPVVAYSDKDDECSGIIGLVNCIRKEPNGLNLRCFLITDPRAPPFNLSNPFYENQLEQNLAINVYKNGQWGSYKHFLLQQETIKMSRNDHCYANYLTRGDLSSMTWFKGPFNVNKPKGKIVKIQYASLNFRDVMLATGKITFGAEGGAKLQNDCVLGLEYAGIHENGKRVMGMSLSGAMASYIETDECLHWEIPDSWTLEQASSVPVVYGTVYSAFFLTTQIERGKKILIHAGTGGVGLAAIRTALAYGLEVFTTVSTEEKRDYLLNEYPELREENIGNSRDTSFEDMVMLQTDGKGVDYVLNSLADDKLQASIRCLGKKGKFLEIGKFDMENDSNIGMRAFLKEISFHSVMVDNLFNASNEEKKVLQKLLETDITRGIIKPIKTNVFPAENVEQAFRFLASAKHIGKVVLKVRKNHTDEMTLPIPVVPRVYCSSSHSYIIPGGLGGFGLELADWLVLRGCRKLVLSSSRGITKQYQAYRIKFWESHGVHVLVNTSDISTRAGCEVLIKNSIKLGPVGGIFNLAVILKDSIFENQDAEKFVECMTPKAVATKYLDELSRKLCPELQYFVVFSSVSCGRGNAGQSNYGMANSVMERIMEQRHSLGLPAKAIQWGAVGEVGLVADMQEDKIDMEIGGTLQQRISSCLEELDVLITCDQPLVASMVVAEKRYNSGGKGNILDSIMNIMSIRNMKSLSMESTLAELGMDSLMAVEIQQTLEREYDTVISVQELRSMTLTDLVKSTNKNCVKNEAEVDVQNNSEKVTYLLRNFGDEANNQKTILKVKSLKNQGEKTLIIPGIESVAGESWYEIAENLQSDVYILQTMNLWNAESLQTIYDGIIKDVMELFQEDKTFSIVCYSFGTLLGHLIAKAFETSGKRGKIIMIDGSSLFVKELLLTQMKDGYNEENCQSFIFMNAVGLIFPENSATKFHEIMNEKTWIERVKKFLDLSKNNQKYSEEFKLKCLNSLRNRIRISVELDLKIFPVFKNTEIVLIRATESSVQNIDENFGLKSYSNQVEMLEVEGDHGSILQNPTLCNILNNRIAK